MIKITVFFTYKDCVEKHINMLFYLYYFFHLVKILKNNNTIIKNLIF